MSTKVVTPEFRASFPNLLQPRLNDLNGKEEYSVMALFKKGEDLSALEAAAKAAIEKKWGTDKKKWPKNLRSPFRMQEEKEKEGADGETTLPDGMEEGAVFLNIKSQKRPGVVDQNVSPVMDESKIYPGIWLRAEINAYPYDQKGNKGVAFGLNHVQIVRDDEPLGNASTPESAFAPIEGAANNTDASELFE